MMLYTTTMTLSPTPSSTDPGDDDDVSSTLSSTGTTTTTTLPPTPFSMPPDHAVSTSSETVITIIIVGGILCCCSLAATMITAWFCYHKGLRAAILKKVSKSDDDHGSGTGSAWKMRVEFARANTQNGLENLEEPGRSFDDSSLMTPKAIQPVSSWSNGHQNSLQVQQQEEGKDYVDHENMEGYMPQQLTKLESAIHLNILKAVDKDENENDADTESDDDHDQQENMNQSW